MREFWLGALEHQDVPFERLVEVLAPDRSLARHPLFQVTLTVQNTPRTLPRRLELPGLRAGRLLADPEAARFDLNLSWPRPGMGRASRAGCAGTVLAAADLFDQAPPGRLRSGLPGCWRWSRVTRGCGCMRSQCWIRASGRRCWWAGMTRRRWCRR